MAKSSRAKSKKNVRPRMAAAAGGAVAPPDDPSLPRQYRTWIARPDREKAELITRQAQRVTDHPYLMRVRTALTTEPQDAGPLPEPSDVSQAEPDLPLTLDEMWGDEYQFESLLGRMRQFLSAREDTELARAIAFLGAKADTQEAETLARVKSVLDEFANPDAATAAKRKAGEHFVSFSTRLPSGGSMNHAPSWLLRVTTYGLVLHNDARYQLFMDDAGPDAVWAATYHAIFEVSALIEAVGAVASAQLARGEYGPPAIG